MSARLQWDRLQVTLDGAAVVRSVSIDCEAGTVVGLLGPNGSGKSTALRAVYRALNPTGGAVLIDGADVRTLSMRDHARQVAALAQERSADFGFSVLDTVRLGRTPHQGRWAGDSQTDQVLIAAALTTVGMQARAGRAFDSLSGGEKQRVLLARALVRQPRVLVLDEPTNHLDIAAQLSLLGLIRGLGVTVLTALHDLNLAAAYCDVLHVLRDGALVASGAPEDVLTVDLIADVFGVRAHRIDHPLTGRLHLVLSPLERIPDPPAAHTPLRATPASDLTQEKSR